MTYPLSGAPVDRESFKYYCFKALGFPVIEINIDDMQAMDRIDDALRFWWDVHADGTFKTYYKYQIQDIDFINRYIQLPANIIGAVSMFDLTTAARQDNIFNIRYQIVMNDLYTLTSVSMAPFFMTMQHLQFLEYLLIGKQPIRYNRMDNKFYLDMDWSKFATGDFIIIDCYSVVDPDVYQNAWGDRLLLRLGVAHMKKQWGQNLIKFRDMKLPGGNSFNGELIYREGKEEIKELEDMILHSYSLPALDMIG